MDKQEFLLKKIEKWVGEGLISPKLAEALKRSEMRNTAISVSPRRVKADEIFVYLGSLVIFLAMIFLVVLNWRTLNSATRILSVLVPAVFMLGLGWRLRGSESKRLKRGAQALWLGGCLLCALFFGVTFYEVGLFDVSTLKETGPGHPLVLTSCLLATSVAGVAFLLFTSVAQSVAFHLFGTASWFSFLARLDLIFPPMDHFYRNLLFLTFGVVAGGLWLALSKWLRVKGKGNLVRVSRIFGTVTILGFTLGLAVQKYTPLWQKTTMEAIAFLTSITFIAASVKRQSQTFLYSGAAFLLILIIHVNVEYFADKIGMPIALLIIGALLIGLGLGTGRLRKRIQTSD